MAGSGEVWDIALEVLRAAHSDERSEVALIAAHDVFGSLDRATLVRVAAGVAFLASRRQAGELTADWLDRLELERAWSTS